MSTPSAVAAGITSPASAATRNTRNFAAVVLTISMAMAQAAHMPKARLLFWLVLAGLVVVLDQLSKALVQGQLLFAERVEVLPVFDITLLYNSGAAFSLLADGAGYQRWFFTLIAVLATVLIVYWLNKNPQQKLFCTALSLILGGAIGNACDRLLHGHVTDFLLFYYNNWYFPAFNVADIAISCGAVLLILDEIRHVRQRRKTST